MKQRYLSFLEGATIMVSSKCPITGERGFGLSRRARSYHSNSIIRLKCPHLNKYLTFASCWGTGPVHLIAVLFLTLPLIGSFQGKSSVAFNAADTSVDIST